MEEKYIVAIILLVIAFILSIIWRKTVEEKRCPKCGEGYMRYNGFNDKTSVCSNEECLYEEEN